MCTVIFWLLIKTIHNFSNEISNRTASSFPDLFLNFLFWLIPNHQLGLPYHMTATNLWGWNYHVLPPSHMVLQYPTATFWTGAHTISQDSVTISEQSEAHFHKHQSTPPLSLKEHDHFCFLGFPATDGYRRDLNLQPPEDKTNTFLVHQTKTKEQDFICDCIAPTFLHLPYHVILARGIRIRITPWKEQFLLVLLDLQRWWYQLTACCRSRSVNANRLALMLTLGSVLNHV